ncbi:LuxS/MPP-like metallohydrolase, partial [Ramicandelaber brevisporus]
MPSAYTSIVVPTQSWDNRGLPHTLEHLIFTGSKQHPHKGFLETVAMRELAEYSNASTHSHFTEYNADCTCAEGLAELIPVYLDHILRPLLTDKQFVTEVYHVAPDGSGKGVVFSEMQGRENTSWDLVENTFGSTLYPKDVPHAHETGGLTPDIAILTNKDIRAFHAAFYRPEYITVLVAG